MGLVDRLAEACPRFPRDVFEQFVVPDFVRHDCVKVVLLCESPHTREVKSCPRTPLMGASGKTVGRALNVLVRGVSATTSQPIGHLVRSDPKFSWLGIMNVCCVPMQRKPYEDRAGDVDCWIKRLKEVRKRREDDPWDETNQVEAAIKDDLRERWRCVESQRRDVLLVPCGGVARRFCRQLAYAPIAPRTPHPSRCRWDEAIEVCRTIEHISAVLADDTK